MKIAKRVPLVRIENCIINLDNLTTFWYDDDGSYQGHYCIYFRVYNSETNFAVKFKTKKAALEALDQIMLAVDIPIIEEDEL